jgi:predicted transcriptional regulator
MQSGGPKREPIQCASFEHSISILHELVVKGTEGPTRLNNHLGLKWSVFKELLASLVEAGLVNSEWQGKRRIFSPTHEGFVVVQQYLELRHRVTSQQLPALLWVPTVGATAESRPLNPPRAPLVSLARENGTTVEPHPSSWRAPSSDSASITSPDDRSDLVCQRCGGAVRVLNQELADSVQGFSVRAKHTRALECRTCEVILLEDELTNGAFVPPCPSDNESPNELPAFV